MMMVVTYMSVMSVLIQSLAALAAEYAVAESQLRDLVVTDPMTGLPNYRRLVEVLTEEITRANRTDTTFAVVFCDMDGLKRNQRRTQPSSTARRTGYGYAEGLRP
jgi:PleD family two-component response regulator